MLSAELRIVFFFLSKIRRPGVKHVEFLLRTPNHMLVKL